ncbi:hypothetical protein [Leptospira ryugenii]|uniref:hypothetical protein n=1 Tax=Leptospira ryugenii TaxID=1917863 RepID=UPI000D59E7D8|nr:hypothetical protein [Leptospira ryugenii]
MKWLVRFPLVLLFTAIAFNFWVCRLAVHDSLDGRFRLGEKIIRYGEEVDRSTPWQPNSHQLGSSKKKAGLL